MRVSDHDKPFRAQNVDAAPNGTAVEAGLHAAGQPTETPAARRDTLLDDILAVVPVTEPKVWMETLVDRLAGLRPDVYGALTRDQLGAALKPYGISTSQVWGTDPITGKGANRRGIERQQIADLVADRNRRREA